MNRKTTTYHWGVLFVFIILIFAGSAFGQTFSYYKFAEDTRINPHDFTDQYYAMQGVLAPAIFGRRDGTDALSVFGNSSNPYHTNVRVVATIPGYNENGDIVFFYPLGELQDTGFMEDKAGMRAHETAEHFPIYVFPNTKVIDYRTFANTRQAAILDNTWAQTNGRDVNPLGLREIFIVNYTDKAFGKDGVEMMQYFAKKNGMSADNTPIVRTMEDLRWLLKDEMITTLTTGYIGGEYAINPEITDPTKGAIATDAFLWMATVEGKPLPAEDMFVWQFHCLQKTQNWCN
ncbi:MAG: hypothetical protein DMF63_16705 [Acidobacteria bacterium]|nr:MAG: hypothetical protein DMF63_16705 [Acidobacteriota bacterium]